MIVAAEPAYRTRAANPYNALLYDAIAARGVDVREFRRSDLLGKRRPDIVHLHWPELTFLSSHRAWQSLTRLAVFDALIGLARRRGTRLVWTMHNDGAHESRGSAGLRARLERLLARRLDAVIVLSGIGERVARERFGADLPVTRTPHGHYRDAYPLDGDRDTARARLGIPVEPTVLAAVGQVRPYKNLPALVAALRDERDDELVVAIAGAPDGAPAAEWMRAAAAADPRLRLELARLDDARMAAWLLAADGVVLPYRRILNSGAALLALSAGRPVIVPAVGAMPELAGQVGADWVRLYEGDFTAEVLRDAVAWVRDTERPAAPDLAAFAWDAIADTTIAGYRRALGAPPRSTKGDR